MSVRSHLHEAVQAAIGVGDDMPEGAMLLGFVLVAEWMAPDGRRWLTSIDAAVDPDRPAAEWQRDGYLFNALHRAEGFGDGSDDPDPDPDE